MPDQTSAVFVVTEPAAPTPFRLDGRRLETARDVATYFDVPLGRMLWTLYKAPEHVRYRAFEIPKRTGGMRPIHAPHGLVRDLQDKLKADLDRLYALCFLFYIKNVSMKRLQNVVIELHQRSETSFEIKGVRWSIESEIANIYILNNVNFFSNFPRIDQTNSERLYEIRLLSHMVDHTCKIKCLLAENNLVWLEGYDGTVEL